MKRETVEQAGYTVESFDGEEAVLIDETGKRELWVVNDGHASYGIRYANHDLEFVRSL
jgi:hypothetical protein